MTEYKPQVGDRVRRTFKHGTVVEGEIFKVGVSGNAYDQEYWNCLYFSENPEQTELLHRPVELKKDPFTIYKDPHSGSFVVRRILKGLTWPWVDECGEWLTDEGVEELVSEGGWVLHES